MESKDDKLLSLISRKSTSRADIPNNRVPQEQAPIRNVSSKRSEIEYTALSDLEEALLRAVRLELSKEEVEESFTEEQIRRAIEKVSKETGVRIDSVKRSKLILELQSSLTGWGILQPLIENNEITDIHCYDYQTVVLQRGKESETTGIRWPTEGAYTNFIDRLLLRMGKSLSTQHHTVDGSFPDGTRVCAIHKSVCGQRGPLLTVRIPRVMASDIQNLVRFEVAPQIIVDYLATLVGTGVHTIIVAGETGTGKTTMVRSFGSCFGEKESIIGVEDTPELNYQHEYYRSLVSRDPNTEGMGEVSLQEHIKSTLRLCPTRVILGEMRTPEAAESFLEAAQTGHSGLSTIHARNARETLTRLESLLGRAQRGVSIDIIRQQVALAVDVVCWCIREKETGTIRLAEVIEIGNYSEGQIQIRPMFNLRKRGTNPQWELLSWSSEFDNQLNEAGVFLKDSPRYFGFEESDPLLGMRANE
jgi:pilus assembly protein CpaF